MCLKVLRTIIGMLMPILLLAVQSQAVIKITDTGYIDRLNRSTGERAV